MLRTYRVLAGAVAVGLLAVPAAFAQSTYDILLFLNQHGQSSCMARNGTWTGMTCDGSPHGGGRPSLMEEELNHIDLPNVKLESSAGIETNILPSDIVDE